MNFRPKVLVVGQDFDLCEANIFSGLVENGVTIEVIMSPALNRKEILEKAGIKVNALGISSRIDLSAIWKLRQRLLSNNYDIVHCLTSRALSNVLLASRNIKTKIVAYRGTVGHLSRIDPSSWLAYLNPKVDKIICVSNSVK
ncbi:MAG: glycosyltransferase [SAR324 cluster bacterium]|uniref:Glycosyltransferase n=1 Tax=SAR324 cluster bacterium TaxID=2024889 RepID=A0A7X9IJ21_9DELT|nr:glycosyltransferase [SAR324 cluster bacterium]